MSQPMRILLVEDEVLNRALIRAILERSPEGLGTTLLEAPSIAAAREILAAQPVDVVLLDVRLPDGSGLDLAAELRARGTRPRIAVLSASVLAEEREAAESSGADAFLGKPFVPRELLDLLRRFRADPGVASDDGAGPAVAR